MLVPTARRYGSPTLSADECDWFILLCVHLSVSEKNPIVQTLRRTKHSKQVISDELFSAVWARPLMRFPSLPFSFLHDWKIYKDAHLSRAFPGTEPITVGVI